jgi:hypothetical protein
LQALPATSADGKLLPEQFPHTFSRHNRSICYINFKNIIIDIK